MTSKTPAMSASTRRGMPATTLLLLISCLLLVAVAPAGRSGGPRPTGTLEMTGDVGDYVPGEIDDPVHDPAIVHDPRSQSFYVFSTGILRTPDDPGGIYVRRSGGTVAGPWESTGEIPVPEWTLEYGHNHLWAPDVVRVGDTFWLYYAASSFGSNTSAIGAMSTTTPGDLDSWVDHGPVVTSAPDPDAELHYNAIDPNVFKAEGNWWIAFGSHWDGIVLQQLGSMTEPTGPVHHLAARPGVQHNPIEAPTIVKRGNYYYLFTSWDRCCAGLDSTYRIAVGRSTSLTGPYVDRDGVPLLEGGGTILLASGDTPDQVGPGGQDVLFHRGRHYLLHHYYDGAADGVIRMQAHTLDWRQGWPQIAG